MLLGVPSLLAILNTYVGSAAISTPSASEILGTLFTYFATLLGSIAAYRISPFHPLARYPGPFIAKLSKLWMVVSFLRLPLGALCVDKPTRCSFAQRGSNTNTMQVCTRSTGTLYGLVNYFTLQFVFWCLFEVRGPNEVIIRDPAAISPLMGTAGWGKSMRESIMTLHNPFADIALSRMVCQGAIRSHSSGNCNTRRTRTCEAPPNVE